LNLQGQPTKIGKYEVVDLIGRGGMGVVYKARDPQLDRLVAIKMIIGANPALLKRFDIEARSTAGLQHQNIVTIYDFGSQDGNPYLVMEYLEGSSLESVISSGRSLTLANKLRICINICNGLSYAHERGIIHRDIKPANVMLLNDESVKIVDFGIARIGDTGISRTEVVGSLHYMSPEQFQSTPLDIRTDIFSTGVVLYRLLTGTLPFQAAGEAAVMYRIIHDDPLPIGSYVQGYPAELDSIVAKALAKNRENRYASCRDLAFDLQLLREQQKGTDVREWLQRAETAIQKTEWNKAEECLKQLLRIEEHNSRAYQMLGEVQERLRQQRRVEQSRHLRTQADEAFLDRRYDDALGILSQAIDVDGTNQDLLRLRQSVQEAKTRATRLHHALRRAEGAQQAGDLDEAKRAVSEALELDPDETSAKALRFVIFKQVEERDRQLALRKLLDDARDQLAARDLTRAIETLQVAEAIDSTSVELRSLQKVANTAREQQMRKAELEKLSRQIEDALAREDYEQASAVATAGLQRHPKEPGLLKLKALAEAEQKRIKLIAYAHERLVTANGLLESGKTLEALSVLERALQDVPGESQLESLRSVIQNRLTQEDAEVHKQTLLERAKEALARKEFREAVRLLEAAQTEFPGRTEIEDLLRASRKEQSREKLVGEVLGFSQQLLSQKGPQAAAEYLEEQVQFVADERVRAALADARRNSEQLRKRIQNALEEGQRILRDHGAQETRKYLEAQPAQFLESAEFKTLSELLRKREACDTLDRELAKQSDIDAQVRIAEEAARKSPENNEIANRLAATRQRKEAIQGIVDRAGALETARQYGAAVQQMGLLRQLQPRYPNLDREIQRLQRLEEQQKSLAAKPATAARPSQPSDSPATDLRATGLQATKMIGSPSAPHSDAAAVHYPESAPMDGTLAPATTFRAAGISRATTKWLGIGAAALLLVGTGIVWKLFSSGAVAVHIQTVPSGGSIRVDGKACPSPCTPQLSVGSHTVDAGLTGYTTSTEKIDVTRGGPTNFDLSLTAESTPGATVGSLAVQTNVEGVDVLVDGVLAGVTGSDHRLVVSGLAPGKHAVTARKSGYQNSKPQQADVAQGRQLDLPLTLVEAKGSNATPSDQYLMVQGPPGAHVVVDKLPPQSIPTSGHLPVTVAPGSHSVEIRMDGYQVWQNNVQVQPGSRLPVVAELKAIAKPVTAATTPETHNPPVTAPTATLIASSDTVEKGQSVELRWDTKAATDITVDGQKVPAQGTKTISPTESGNHYLVAHGPGGDAKDVAHVEVKAPAPPPAKVSDDQSGIQGVLDAYVVAFQSKDPANLRRIWPVMSDKTFKEMQGNFKDAESFRINLRKTGPAQVNGKTAVATCIQDAQIKPKGGQTQSFSQPATFYFKKLGDKDSDWTIDRVEYGKATR
jgi:eukaryotic-like serine/threonine-protein kinase